MRPLAPYRRPASRLRSRRAFLKPYWRQRDDAATIDESVAEAAGAERLVRLRLAAEVEAGQLFTLDEPLAVTNRMNISERFPPPTPAHVGEPPEPPGKMGSWNRGEW